MTSIGERLLELQKEYADREMSAHVAGEFGQDDWRPRAVAEIAADYEATLRKLLTS